MRLLHKLIFTVLSVLPLSAATAQDWDVVQVPSPPNGFGSPNLFDLNNSGAIAGTSCNQSPCNGPSPIFYYGGVSSFLDHPIQRTEAFGISNNNLVVGYSWDQAQSVNVATKWDNGVRIQLGKFLDYSETYAIDANNSGIIIGHSFHYGSSNTFAWVWENGVFTALPSSRENYFCQPSAINESGVIVGNCFKNPSSKYVGIAHVWPENRIPIELIGLGNQENDSTTVFDINNNGEIVGGINNFLLNNTNYNRAVYWNNLSSIPITLHSPNKNINGESYKSKFAAATSINNLGNITGAYEGLDRGGTLKRALYWHAQGSQSIDLSVVVYPRIGYLSNHAYRINDCSQILIETRFGPLVPQRTNLYADQIYLNPTGCICGVNTQDANNNKIIDCMEPTAATKPPAPVIGVKGARVFVNVAVPPPGMGYKTVVQVYNSKNRRIGKKTTSGSQVEFKKLFGRTRKGQRLTVKANIYWTNGTITTQTSKRITKKFRVK